MTDLDGRLLALFGLDSGSAAEQLAPLGLAGDDLVRVLERLGLGAHPPTALSAVCDLAARDADAWHALAQSDDHLRRLAFLAGASDALPDLVVRSAAARDVLRGDLTAWSFDDVHERARAALDHDGATTLAELQRLGALRVALRDLLGMADTPTATAELSDLAEGVIGAAFGHVTDGDDIGLAVIAMGKLGGRELNYVSDVDLLFVASDANATSDAARSLLDVLGSVTPAGRVYEIDTNLRPEGSDGALVRSIAAYERYYTRWAKTWEFQALLKAATGMLTAILGLLFLRAGIVPGFTQVDTQSQILVYAVVFGASQELITRFVDQRSNDLLAAVTSTEAEPGDRSDSYDE